MSLLAGVGMTEICWAAGAGTGAANVLWAGGIAGEFRDPSSFLMTAGFDGVADEGDPALWTCSNIEPDIALDVVESARGLETVGRGVFFASIEVIALIASPFVILTCGAGDPTELCLPPPSFSLIRGAGSDILSLIFGTARAEIGSDTACLAFSNMPLKNVWMRLA